MPTPTLFRLELTSRDCLASTSSEKEGVWVKLWPRESADGFEGAPQRSALSVPQLAQASGERTGGAEVGVEIFLEKKISDVFC